MKEIQGFTLLEVMVVVIITSLASLFLWVPEMEARVRDLHRTRADVTIEEIRRLGTAAQLYTLNHNGDWPDLANRCQGSLGLLQLSYLNSQSPFYTGASLKPAALPEELKGRKPDKIGEYAFACPPPTIESQYSPEWILQLALSGKDTIWAAYIANQFAGAAHFDLADYSIVEVATLLPSAIPALDAYLPRDGSEPMLGNLDMGGNDVHKVGDVILDTGQTLGSVPVLQVIARPGNQVKKPDCPPQYKPAIFVTPQSIAHSRGLPMTRFRVWASDLGNAWRIHSEVFGTTASPDKNNATTVLVNVTAKCAL